MPPAIPVVLDHLRFASQNQARQHFSDMLHRYQPGQSLNPADTTELQSLLKRHPLHGKTATSNSSHIQVIQTGFGRHCFSATQADQSKRSFSFIQSIRNCRDHPEPKPETIPPDPKKIAPEAPNPQAQTPPQEQASALSPAPIPKTKTNAPASPKAAKLKQEHVQ